MGSDFFPVDASIPFFVYICANPTAIASAASGVGVSFKDKIERIMNATCSFFAAPLPTTACLILLGAYSYTGMPLEAAAMIAAALAAPIVIAVL